MPEDEEVVEPAASGEPLPRATPAEITEYARGIVTGQLMVADLSDSSWQASLMLLLGHLAEIPNVGLILVPLGPHQHGYWINGVAPGVTLSAKLVAQEDLDALQAEVSRMSKALFPDQDDE